MTSLYIIVSTGMSIDWTVTTRDRSITHHTVTGKLFNESETDCVIVNAIESDYDVIILILSHYATVIDDCLFVYTLLDGDNCSKINPYLRVKYTHKDNNCSLTNKRLSWIGACLELAPGLALFETNKRPGARLSHYGVLQNPPPI